MEYYLQQAHIVDMQVRKLEVTCNIDILLYTMTCYDFFGITDMIYWWISMFWFVCVELDITLQTLVV